MSIEEQLFGVAKLLEVTGDHEPDAEKLREELPDKDYAVRFHCKGCGTSEPVLRKAVPSIVGQERPSYAEHYIATERCDHCLSEGFRDAHIESIPDKK